MSIPNEPTVLNQTGPRTNRRGYRGDIWTDVSWENYRHKARILKIGRFPEQMQQHFT